MRGVGGREPMSALHELLEHNLRSDPEFQGGLLTNHLSMCLVAFDRLGASPVRLREFFESYRAPLRPLHDDGGRRAALARRLLDVGRDALLRERLPSLVPGLAGAAFHGLIRLAYALESGQEGELVHALAYFEECALPLNVDTAEADEGEPLALLGELHALHLPRPAGGNIAIRMQRAFAAPGVALTLSRLRIDECTLTRLAAAALRLYAGSDDFTALHAVTATHAARLLQPYADSAALTRALWLAIAAAYVSTGSPPLPGDEGLSALLEAGAPDWAAISALATRSSDDHVAKITWSCQSEDSAYDDPLYRVVAWRAAGRGHS